MYRLLIVEDDKGIAEAIKTQAEMWNLQVHCIEDFRIVMTEFAEFDPLFCWILRCLSSMGITGAVRSAKFPKYQSYLSHQLLIT